MKVLLVEDNERVTRFVTKGLQEAGHTADHADNGRDGLFLAASERYDVIIMDRMLPGNIDGLSLISALRQSGNQTPILILSALADVDERIKGLRAGGDDYLTKPFAFGELLARLDALGRRTRQDGTVTTLEVADLKMDLLSRKVLRGARQILLQPREFKLLEYLMRHAGPGGHPYHAAGECLGLSFRSPDQCRGRAYQQAAPEDRTGAGTLAAAHRAQRRLHAERRVATVALFIRSSATTLAAGYVLLGILALVLFALPLGYAWRAADNDMRLQILGEDSQRLAEVFNRKGPGGPGGFHQRTRRTADRR